MYFAIMLIVSLNSPLERNLNRVGQRFSWATLTPKDLEAKDQARSFLWKIGKYFLVVGLTLPLVLLSWANVIYVVCVVAHRLANQFGAPQAVRDYR